MLRKERSGFTLLELLVVISITALLLGILLPVLGRARARGKRTACLSNMNQLTKAWLMYANDNEYELISANTKEKSDWVYDGNSTSGNPVNADAVRSGKLFPYLKVEKIYRCPADKSGFLHSYSINYYLNGEKPRTCKTLPQIRRPDEKFVFIEENDRNNNVGWNVNSWVLISNDQPWTDNIVAWHSNGTNMSFADSHAEYYKWNNKETLNYAKGGDRPTNTTEAINEDFEFLKKATGGPPN
jgi:prepilin-type N-terminal cleavage/methylation domain-containing protein/prepilin-type processing-associated H-X9-DG protein